MASQRPVPEEQFEASMLPAGVTRKQVLQRASALGVGLSAPALLAACGGGEDKRATGTTPGTQPAGGTARRGGRLTVAVPSAGQAETFTPLRIRNPPDSLRVQSVFDGFMRPGTPADPFEPGLVLEWLPNKDGTVWELKLRPDVTWHDGKDFTADDVIFTLRSWGDKTSFLKPTADLIDLDSLKKLDALTLRVPMKVPQARLYESFGGITIFIIQDGQTDFTKPIGTGPFMFESFTPGKESVVKRNPNYWDEGRPYLDSIRIVSIADDTARFNALLSGSVDVIQGLPFSQGKRLESDDSFVLVKALADYYSFYMRVDEGPFSDVRVRQAMRLIADRQALIDGALGGFGEVRNDLTGYGLQFYAKDLPQRKQDIEQAKSLLKQAGAEDLSVTLRTTVAPGYPESAQLYAQQAKAAGVRIRLQQVDPTAYFNASLGYLSWPFGQSSAPNGAAITGFYRATILSTALINETHWKDPKTDAEVKEATSTQDKARATELWHAVQQRQYDSGGYLIWSQSQNLGATSAKVGGVKREGWQSVGDGRVWDWWK